MTRSPAEIDRLAGYLLSHLNRGNAGFCLCLCTGNKLSEICSLRDGDFDLANDRIHIRRTLQHVTMPERSEKSGELTVEYGSEDSGCRDLKIPVELSMRLWALIRDSSESVYFLTAKTSLWAPVCCAAGSSG